MLRVNKISKVYRKETVLKDINFEINDGEILGLVGESGCGKSTLARILTRYEVPTNGQVFFRDEDVHSLNKSKLHSFRKNCQLIFQDNLGSLDPMMSIGETLHEVLRYNFFVDKLQRNNKIFDYLERVHLSSDIVSRLPYQISGGERQRVNVCRALLMEPSLIVCDEITSSLDVITQLHLLHLLREINGEIGTTILFISHDINAVKSISNRVLVMYRGQLVEVLSKENDFSCSEPYTKELLHSLPINHPYKRDNLARHFEDDLLNIGS